MTGVTDRPVASLFLPENTRGSLHMIDETNMKFVLAQIDL